MPTAKKNSSRRPVALALCALVACAGAAATASAVALGQDVRLTLEEALALAARTAPAVRAADAQAGAARARVAQARAARFPTLTLSAFDTPKQQSPRVNIPEGAIVIGGVRLPAFSFEARTTRQYVTVVDLAQPLWTWGRIGLAARAAGAQADAADLATARARDDVVLRVSTAFDAALLAERLEAVAAEDSALRDRVVGVAEDRARAGDLARIDVVATKSDAAASRAALARAHAGVSVARAALALAIGLADTADVRPVGDLRERALGDAAREPGALLARALERRPDLAAAGLAVQAAEAGRAAAARANWPAAALQGRLLYQADDLDRLRRGDGRVYTVAVGVTAPLFDGFLTRARVREAAATARAADAASRGARLVAGFDVRRAVAEYGAAQAEIGARKEAAALAAERVTIAETAFRTGVLTATDVAAAALGLSAAESALAEAIARERDTAAELEHAIGGPLP